MRNNITNILVALALVVPVNAVTAASKSPKLAKCKGKERPANPYGTILPTVDPLSGTSTPGEGADSQEKGPEQERKSVNVFPGPERAVPSKPADKPVRRVPPISSASPQTPYRSC